MIKCVFIIIYVLLGTMLFQISCFSQNQLYIDSLNKCLKVSKVDTQKVNLLNRLGLAYDNNNSFKELSYSEEALRISNTIGYKNGKLVALNTIGNAYNGLGDYETAKEYFVQLKEFASKITDSLAYSKAICNLGYSNLKEGNFDEALRWYIDGLKLADKQNDLDGKANILNQIGQVYDYKRNSKKAIENYQQAFEIYSKLNDSLAMAKPITDIGNSYSQQFDFDNARKQFELALRIYKKFNDKDGISSCLNNLGIVYYESGEKQKSLESFKEVLNIAKNIGDKSGIATAYMNIANFYLREGDYPESMKNLESSLSIAKGIKAKTIILPCYLLISEVSEQMGNINKAYEYHKYYTSIKDSIMDEESAQIIEELQAKYQFEKNQKEIELLNKDRQIQKVEITKQKTQKYAFLIGFSLMVLFLLVVFYSYRKIKTQKIVIENKNEILNQQNEEITTQKDEIEAQRDEIEAQRDLVIIQKEKIEEIHKDVTDSINYAKRIQEAVLPISSDSRSVLGEHFILFKPKDIVSGDFYWTTKINNLLFISVADCTGHGVPGAFMSMLGISFLNEIVQKQEIQKASHILNILRLEIINALQQKGVQGEQKDGMDISLLVINTDTNEAQWAGANNPLYIVKSEKLKAESEELSTLDFQLYELKGDKMPIAIYPKMNDFINHEFSLQQGDCIYLFTDGYADQFGGLKGRKFLYKQFKEVLLNNCNKSMLEQKEILESEFENWRGEYEQVDDITVLGIKI